MPGSLTRHTCLSLILVTLSWLLPISCVSSTPTKTSVSDAAGRSSDAPPVAEKRPTTLSKHGDARVDPYFWMKERDKPEVVAYLEAENRYADSKLSSLKDLQAEIFEEFKSRIPAIEESAPVLNNGYFYYTRQKQGENYGAVYRKKGSLKSPEELVLDYNQLSKGLTFFQASGMKISPDDRYIAYGFDSTGRRFYDIKVLERKTHKEVLTIPKTTGNFEWANDSRTIFFSKQDPETLRADRVFSRNLAAKTDRLVLEEKDSTFALSLEKSRTDAYIFIGSISTLTHEWLYIPADKPLNKPTVIQGRTRGLEYTVEDGGDQFYVITNYQAPNFQIMSVPRNATASKNWVSVLKPDATVFRKHLDVFKSHLVVTERAKGDDILRVISRTTGKQTLVPFADPVYQASIYRNPEYDSKTFLFSYQSLTKPPTVFSYRFDDGEQELIKAQEIPGLDTALYVTERTWVKARDGVLVPMSLVYKKGLKKDGSNPALIYGYGSYGNSMDPSFSATRLSLLDRGFIYAIAHIRGGSEMGRPWYEDGKLMKKKNTFTDFIDCSQYLVDQKFTSPKHLYTMGGSAGGLLMGAVLNARPDLYHGAVAQVPFVDVVTTMLDETIPLTTAEYDEWGDPNNKEAYTYMKSYSPYDNVTAQTYPNLLVVTGFHDSQVQYWEPAKWVAKLRDMKTDNNTLLFKTNMNAGHGGASGRYEALKDRALWWSFFIGLENSKVH